MEITGSLFLSLNVESGALPSSLELIPAGILILGRDGRKWKNSNPKKVAFNSMARLSRLVIDENHATDLSAPKGGASPAMGWITNLHAAENGSIHADVEWTKRGSEAVLNKEYSFISPVFLHDSKGEITTVLRAALTNSPNLQLPALNSEQQKNTTEEVMDKKALCEALGLPETASDDEVLAAVKAAQGKALNAAGQGTPLAQTDTTKVDLAAYAPRADLNAMEARAVSAEKQITALNAAQLKKDAEAVVDAAVKARKIAPASRDEYLALCSASTGDLERMKNIFSKSPEIISTETLSPEGMPPAKEGLALNAESTALAKAMGYTTEGYQKAKEDGK